MQAQLILFDEAMFLLWDPSGNDIKPNKYTRYLLYVEYPGLKCKMKIYFPIDRFELVKKNNANKGGICLLPLGEHRGES